MTVAPYRLESVVASSWRPERPLYLFACSIFPTSCFPGFTLVYTSLTRVIDLTACENATVSAPQCQFP